ncbi:MAG: biopolymer transporter ExbD [Opitutales bacterium]|nr:biopolymer transporter ExbD [Opitutales bacterium]
MDADAKEAGAVVTGAVASSITRPLNFRSLLRRQPGLRWSGLPFVDLTMIAAFLALGASPFLFIPGAEVDLVEVETGLLGSRAPAAVLTAGANQLFFFEGLKVDREALLATLAAYVANHPGETRRLLLKIDQDTPLEDVFRILETARRAGFSSVHLAADERRREEGGPR